MTLADRRNEGVRRLPGRLTVSVYPIWHPGLLGACSGFLFHCYSRPLPWRKDSSAITIPALGHASPTSAYLAELTSARDRLKAALSNATPEPGAEPLTPANEIAERIKSLKSAHSIGPAPQRLASLRTATAEEPVTARIRRPVDPPAEPEPVVEPVADASPVITEPIILRIDADTPALARPEPSYQDRIASGRPKKARQLGVIRGSVW